MGGIDNIEKNNSLSENQQERMVEISECLDIVHSIASKLEDSNQAYEIGLSIKEFMQEFNNDQKNKKEGMKFQNLSLGKLLLSPNNFDISESELDDTKDKKIATFIKDKLASKIQKNELDMAA